MHRSLLWLSCLLLLAGCQNLPIEQDYDTQRDFSRYQSWQWAEPAVQFRPDSPLLRSDLTAQRIRQATAEQLLQRGLRESPTADLKVQASLVVEQRQQHISSGYASSYWGYPWGYWGAPVETRTLDYQVATLQLDLFDTRDGKLVWRGSLSKTLRDGSTPSQREAEIRQVMTRLLSHYPPQ